MIVKGRRILTWSHYERLLQVSDATARAWYEKEAIEQSWSVKTLRRNISTQYYDRMLLSTDKDSVRLEMQEKTNPYQNKYEFLRNPIIADFLGMEENREYLESELEKNIIANLEKFMMELGKGFAFVERQQRVHTDKETSYFLNIICEEKSLLDKPSWQLIEVNYQEIYQKMPKLSDRIRYLLWCIKRGIYRQF